MILEVLYDSYVDRAGNFFACTKIVWDIDSGKGASTLSASTLLNSRYQTKPLINEGIMIKIPHLSHCRSLYG